jgi:hypothetical protein
MTEELSRLLRSATPSPPLPLLDGRALATAARRRSRRRSAAAVGGTVLAVLLAVGLVAGPSLITSDPPTYAGSGPELGRAQEPRELSVGPGQRLRVRRADVLAVLPPPEDELRLVGLELVDGRQCLAVSGQSSCSAPGRPLVDAGAGQEQLSLQGFGRSGGPGLLKDPPLTWGWAPAGTRTVRFVGPRGTVMVRAYDGGPDWEGRAFFLSRVDLLGGGTATALDAQGAELARTVQERFTPPFDCEVYRNVTRSHLSRALMVGLSYAKEHPEFADPARLSAPRSGRANTSEGVTEMFTRNLAAPERMAPEERFEHRLAALVVLEVPQCWDATLPGLAKRFLAASG